MFMLQLAGLTPHTEASEQEPEPSLAPLHMEEQQFYFELLLDDPVDLSLRLIPSTQATEFCR